MTTTTPDAVEALYGSLMSSSGYFRCLEDAAGRAIAHFGDRLNLLKEG